MRLCGTPMRRVSQGKVCKRNLLPKANRKSPLQIINLGPSKMHIILSSLLCRPRNSVCNNAYGAKLHESKMQAPPELLAVVLAQGLEDDGAGGGIDAHGEGLRAEQHLQQAAAEQHLHHLLHDRQQPCGAGRTKELPTRASSRCENRTHARNVHPDLLCAFLKRQTD